MLRRRLLLLLLLLYLALEVLRHERRVSRELKLGVIRAGPLTLSSRIRRSSRMHHLTIRIPVKEERRPIHSFAFSEFSKGNVT
jgi:hypothetical protein